MGMQLDTSLFSPNKIKQIILDNQKNSSEERTGPAVAFLPEGRHSIRWFFDPKGEIYREVVIGRVNKKRFICPNFMSRIDKMNTYPTCRICDEAQERDRWKDKCRYNCMVYGYLLDTKNPGEYWKAGQPYVIIGNSYLRRALVDMMENLYEDGMDMLMSMLTPNVKGFISNTSVTKGQQGNISIQVLTKSMEALNLGDWYLPLDQVYLKAGFELKAYEDAVEEYLANLEQEEAEDAEEETGDGSEVGTIVQTSSNGANPTSAAATVTTNLDDGMIEVTTRKPTLPKKVTKRGAVAELPDHITLDMLPEGCPGWGQYNSANTVCALCEHNLDCMSTQDSK